MKVGHRRGAVLLTALALVACAGPAKNDSGAVIEPGGGNAIEPTVEPGAPSPAPIRRAYELTRKEEERVRALDVHLGDRWFEFRGERLGLSLVQAKKRDEELSERRAPAIFWDEQTAIETASVWTALCNECHGGRRRLTDARSMPPPPSDWGGGQGFFFGQQRQHADMFRMISKGGKVVNGNNSEMPAWERRLSKEIIWSLVYFIEYQSGGIEGNFPPSLYPVREGE